MTNGRFIIEFGMGMDFHGQDVNKAAMKAVKHAVSQSCLSGLQEVLDLQDMDNEIRISVTVAVTDPAAVKEADIASCLPVGTVEVKAVAGGMKVPGLYIPAFGDADDSIVAAMACVEVFVQKQKG